MAFGLTSMPMYRWLKFGRRVLLYAIQNHPAAALGTITQDNIDTYKAAIAAKYPILEDVWGACEYLFWGALETDCTLLAGVKDEVVVVQKRQQTGLLRRLHYPRCILKNGRFTCICV